MTKRGLRILLYTIIGCLLLAAISAHIAFLWWERGSFAPGSEWAMYVVIAIVFMCRVLKNEY